MTRNQLISGAAALAVIAAPALALAGPDATAHHHAMNREACSCTHAGSGMNGMHGTSGMHGMNGRHGASGMPMSHGASTGTTDGTSTATAATPSADLQNIWSSP